jgi:hypothetical protein
MKWLDELKKKVAVQETPEGLVMPEGILVARTTLVARHLDKDGNEKTRRVVKDKVVTTAFVGDIVDVLTGTTGDHDTFINYKFHDSGTGTATEAAANTALTSACGDSRDAGTQIEGTAANIYKSVATHTYGSTHSITEHGIFNVSSGGTLMDRTVFAAINVDDGEKIEFTFTITFSSGG